MHCIIYRDDQFFLLSIKSCVILSLKNILFHIKIFFQQKMIKKQKKTKNFTWNRFSRYIAPMNDSLKWVWAKWEKKSTSECAWPCIHSFICPSTVETTEKQKNKKTKNYSGQRWIVSNSHLKRSWHIKISDCFQSLITLCHNIFQFKTNLYGLGSRNENILIKMFDK